MPPRHRFKKPIHNVKDDCLAHLYGQAPVGLSQQETVFPTFWNNYLVKFGGA